MTQTRVHETIVVGAGLSGLSLARALVDQGHEVVLLERSRGVGGRCATRRVGDERVDHGLPLLHGRSAVFVEAVQGGQGYHLLADWPFHLRGSGTPCQPAGFRSSSRRFAIVEGLSAFAKHLAQGLEVRRETTVHGLEIEGETLRVRTSAGELCARTVVLTCPVPEALALLAPLARHGDELAGVLAALRQVFTLPALTLLCGYDRPSATDWHLVLPGARSVIHSLVNDSSKRGPAARQVLVIQGRAGFSREHLEAEPALWSEALVHAAAAELGDWVLSCRWQQAQKWRHARVQRGSELAHPVLLSWDGGARLGLCGEAFNPAGGAEGAFLSGLELAARLRCGSATAATG